MERKTFVSITKYALRHLITTDNGVSETHKCDALDEYVRLCTPVAPGILPNVQELHDRRCETGRIATIKYVREQMQCGLLEALIIVKGIESHYDIIPSA